MSTAEEPSVPAGELAHRLGVEKRRCVAIAVAASSDLAAAMIDEAIRLNHRAMAALDQPRLYLREAVPSKPAELIANRSL